MGQPNLRDIIPEKTARELSAVAIGFANDGIKFLVPHGFNGDKTDSLMLATGKWVKLDYADETEIKAKLNELYGATKNIGSSSSSYRYRAYAKSENLDVSDLRKQLDTAPIVKLVDEMLTSGIKWSASDIHIEPMEREVRIRYRLDGKLQEAAPIPIEKKQAVISRIKVMAELDIAERRRPQDGRIRVEGEDRIVDMRVSVIPTDFGEKVVIRILDKTQLKLELKSLGMSPDQLELFKNKLTKPNGIILVTGPTGSGKTTSLYAALNHIKCQETNIITIEDPIEYNLSGINQSQVKPEIGYSFANALRTFLRQDPDIIMVGEIRDHETAEIAVRASLTGHLVLSTLHTNDAASAITRLINMNVEPYLIASSLSLVIAQRLVRVLCSECKREHTPSSMEIEKFKLEHDIKIFSPVGCDKCLGTGYIGRMGIYEFLDVNDGVTSLILQNAPLKSYRDLIKNSGSGLLSTNASTLLIEGKTSLAEIVSL